MANAIIVAGALEIGVEKRGREILAAVGRQIHHQEGDVIHHIDPAKLRIEIQAIDREQLSLPPGDVACMQIAVTFADGTVQFAHAQWQAGVQIIMSPVDERPQLRQQ